MTPEQEHNAKLVKLSIKLHQQLLTTLDFLKQEKGAPWGVTGNLFEEEETQTQFNQLINDVCSTIGEGAKLNTCYSDGSVPLLLAMSIYAQTGDDRVLKAMTSRETEPAKIRRQGDFEWGFIDLVNETADDPKHLDRLLSLLDESKEGRKIVVNLWPHIAAKITSKSRYFVFPEMLSVFMAHGHDLKGAVGQTSMSCALEGLNYLLYDYGRGRSEEYKEKAIARINRLLEHYKGDVESIPSEAPSPPAPAAQGVQVADAQVTLLKSPDKDNGIV